jgi:hypothetical protein
MLSEKPHQAMLGALGAKRRAHSKKKQKGEKANQPALTFSQTLLPMAKRCPGGCAQLKIQVGFALT